MNPDIALLEHAAAILDAEALALRMCHNIEWENPAWKDEPDAKREHDDMKKTSTGLLEMAARLRFQASIRSTPQQLQMLTRDTGLDCLS